ncbi:hypothetical protein AB4254_13680 [Vibrio breoganii]
MFTHLSRYLRVRRKIRAIHAAFEVLLEESTINAFERLQATINKGYRFSETRLESRFISIYGMGYKQLDAMIGREELQFSFYEVFFSQLYRAGEFHLYSVEAESELDGFLQRLIGYKQENSFVSELIDSFSDSPDWGWLRLLDRNDWSRFGAADTVQDVLVDEDISQQLTAANKDRPYDDIPYSLSINRWQSLQELSESVGSAEDLCLHDWESAQSVAARADVLSLFFAEIRRRSQQSSDLGEDADLVEGTFSWLSGATVDAPLIEAYRLRLSTLLTFCGEMEDANANLRERIRYMQRDIWCGLRANSENFAVAQLGYEALKERIYNDARYKVKFECNEGFYRLYELALLSESSLMALPGMGSARVAELKKVFFDMSLQSVVGLSSDSIYDGVSYTINDCKAISVKASEMAEEGHLWVYSSFGSSDGKVAFKAIAQDKEYHLDSSEKFKSLTL